MPTAAEARALLRALLRTAHSIKDYNVREYAKRRTLGGFRESKAMDSEGVQAAYAKGTEDLAMMKRQAIVYNLYAGGMPSVLETGAVGR